MVKIPRVIRAYIAGYVDGEGCIRWDRCTPEVRVESCNPFPARLVSNYFGGEVKKVNRKTKVTNRSVYRLSYYGENAIALLRSILEFLIEKKKQASGLITMWEANKVISVERHKSH